MHFPNRLTQILKWAIRKTLFTLKYSGKFSNLNKNLFGDGDRALTMDSQAFFKYVPELFVASLWNTNEERTKVDNTKIIYDW